MSGHKRKRCWFCAQRGVVKTFKNRVQMRAHIFSCHDAEELKGHLLPKFHEAKKPGMPNIVHYGARMRKKLGLEYNKAGHLRSTLEAVA